MKRVALFGGSFNPPHVGHEAILTWLRSPTCPVQFDDIWVLPAVVHAFDKTLLPYETRAKLVAAMAPTVEVVRRDEKHTVNVLEALHVENPDTQFVLVLGTDIWHERHKWHRWTDVERLGSPLFVSRKGVDSVEGVQVYPIEAPDVSSTEVRQKLAEGDLFWCTLCLPTAVFSLIFQQGWYTEPVSALPGVRPPAD